MGWGRCVRRPACDEQRAVTRRQSPVPGRVNRCTATRCAAPPFDATRIAQQGGNCGMQLDAFMMLAQALHGLRDTRLRRR